MIMCIDCNIPEKYCTCGGTEMTKIDKARVITSVLFFSPDLLPADDWRVVQVARQSTEALTKSYNDAVKLWNKGK